MFISYEPSLVRSLAEANREFGGNVIFYGGGDGSVQDFGVSSYAVLVGLIWDVIEWTLVDDVGIIGAVEFMWGVVEEMS